MSQLVNKETAIVRPDRGKSHNMVDRDPLGLHSGSLCSVDTRHECHRSSKCEPSWGLLGCIELYKLQTVDERIEYCKESSCCTSCGLGNLSKAEESNHRHRRCDYKSPVDRFILKCTAWRSKDSSGRKLYCYHGAALCKDHQNLSNTNKKLLDWLKERKVRHDLFLVEKPIVTKKSKSQNPVGCNEALSDQKVMNLLREKMDNSDFEQGEVQDIPKGESLFMFFLLQGKAGTEPIQVFGDSGANFWFANDSVTNKLVCVQTHKGAIPINIAGGKVIHSTGEWAAAIPLADGSYQAVRGLTMKNVVGQMPRYNLTKVLNNIKNQYKGNKRLQELVVPSILGGDIDMILGSKYLKIYPETIQVTPSGLTVSLSRLRSPDGIKAAVISGPVEFASHIFQSSRIKDSIKSMKAMLLHLKDYRPTLEFFPTTKQYVPHMVDDDIPGVMDLFASSEDSDTKECEVRSNCANVNSVCRVTVQKEMKKFMDLQESGLKTDFRCKQCRNCDNCRKGAGQEKLSLKQEAEQELVRQSVTIKDGVAIAKLPFTMSPEDHLKNNRHIALKMLDQILKKHCSDETQRAVVWKAWEKLINKGHLVFLKDLDSNERDMIEKSPTSYYIPWNLAFKDSLSTPIRPVFNASSATATGYSLNDCLAKGDPDLVKLLALLLEWQMGSNAFSGDISQFYPTIQLIPEHWKYQRILLRKNLDPSGHLLEAVLVKLAFGVQSVSAQSEEAVKIVARELWESFPDVAALLIKFRYVDDIAKSTNSLHESLKITADTSTILKEHLNMEIKGWSFTGQDPPPDVTKDGISVDIGGHIWYTKADMYSCNIPPICLTKKKRGKLPDGAFIYDPKTMTIEDFVPQKLSRRMCTSVVAKIWDPLGKKAPITLRLKHDLRKLISESPDWDDAIAQQARALWVQNFEIIENIRGLVYLRCSKPADALRNTCRLWVLVDAAEWGMILTVYVGWERQDGSYSCSHLLGKGLLGPEALTLPQKELHILSAGADISELLSVMLSDWVEEILVAGDSEIALCWTAYESVKLNLYNRVRVINITSKISLENLFHVKGSENPADIGTRLKGIKAEDIYPGSDYLCGKPWMRLSKNKAIETGKIRPISQIKLGHDQKRVMKKGIVFDGFEKEQEDIIGVFMTARIDIDKVALREAESGYMFSPMTRNFLSFVDVTALTLKAARIFKNSINKETIETETCNTFSILAYYSDQIKRMPPAKFISVSDRNEALEFIFKTETKLVKKFNSGRKLENIAVEENGILYCQSRILEGQSVQVVGGLKIDESLTGLFNLNFKVPIIDQHSPLAYPLALHLHNLFNHRGIESCYRLSLNYVKILGGMKIFRKISLNCVTCLQDRKMYVKMIMGSLADTQLTISPVFYFSYVDMWGPLKAYCPGYGKLTRREKGYEVYFLVFACVSTGAINVQLIEGKSTEFVLEGCSRFFNEACVPAILYPDDDGALVKAFREGKMDRAETFKYRAEIPCGGCFEIFSPKQLSTVELGKTGS